MMRDTQSDRALREADRMRVSASQYAQMGFPALAKWLSKNAESAMKWAAKQGAAEEKRR